jgi:hypothetical protein
VKSDQTPVVVLATCVKRDQDREQVGHAVGRKDLLSPYIFVLIYWLLSRLLYKVITISCGNLNLTVVQSEINHYVYQYNIIAKTR